MFLAGVGAAVLAWSQANRNGHLPRPVPGREARFVLAGIAGMAILFAITLSNMDLAMKVRLAEARKSGMPVLLALTPPPIADNDNAAPIYEEAFAALTPLERLPQRWKQKMETWKKREWQQAYQWDFRRLHRPILTGDKEWKEFLHSQDKALTLLLQAASKPACRFPHNANPLTFFEGRAGVTRRNQILRRRGSGSRRAGSGGSRRYAYRRGRHRRSSRHRSPHVRCSGGKGLETLADVLHLSPPTDELAQRSRIEGSPIPEAIPEDSGQLRP